MKFSDKYRHYKGGEYSFIGIALPLEELFSYSYEDEIVTVGTVRYHENTHDIRLFSYNGVLLVEHELPLVIYQSDKDGREWGREVDNFFGYTKQDGELVKRFVLYE